MLRVTDLDTAGTGDRGIRIDQIDRIQKPSASVALISTRLLITAGRARPFHVTVRKKAAVIDRVNLTGRSLFDQTGILKSVREGLRKFAVRLTGRTTKPVER